MSSRINAESASITITASKKGADDEQAFDKRVTELCSELQEGELVEEHKKAYARLFEVKDTSVR